MNHHEWQPGMPELTQAELDARRARIDWLRALPIERWPVIGGVPRIAAGCIAAARIDSCIKLP